MAISTTLKGLTSRYEEIKSNPSKDLKVKLEAIYQLNDISANLFQLLKDSGSELTHDELDQAEKLSADVLKLQKNIGAEVKPAVEASNEQFNEIFKSIKE